MNREHISFSEYSFCMNRIAWWLVKNRKSFKMRNIYNHYNRVADKKTVLNAINERKDNVHKDALINEFVECAIFDNKEDLTFLPNYVVTRNKRKLYKDTYVDMANRVSAYEVINNRSPAIVYLEEYNTTNHNSDETLEYFENKFGKVSDIDSCLKKIQGKGYKLYFNSKYNTKETINRMKKGYGVNCTDSSQVFYRLAISLGYQVQFIHIQCKSGTGHIRLRLRHHKNTGGYWIYRDPASVLAGNSIRSNWCEAGKIIAYDPKWIFTDLHQ